MGPRARYLPFSVHLPARLVPALVYLLILNVFYFNYKNLKHLGSKKNTAADALVSLPSTFHVARRTLCLGSVPIRHFLPCPAGCPMSVWSSLPEA